MPPSPPPSASHTTLPPTNPTPLTKCERSALLHWSLYGQGHDPSIQDLKPRASPPKQAQEMSKPVFSHWNVPLSVEQMEKLRRGFEPEMMEDKWLVYAVDGDGKKEKEKEKEGGFGDGDVGGVELKSEKRGGGEGGDDSKPGEPKHEMMRVFMVRSWTGKPIYEIRILVLRDGGRKKEEGEGGGEMEMEIHGRIEGLVWESDEEVITGQDEGVAKERAREVCRWILGVQLLPDVPKPRRGGRGSGSGKD